MCLCSYKSIQRERWGFSLSSVLCSFPAYTHHKNTIRYLLILQIITFVSIFSVLSPVCWRFRFVCFFLLSFMLPYCFAYLRTVVITLFDTFSDAESNILSVISITTTWFISSQIKLSQSWFCKLVLESLKVVSANDHIFLVNVLE